MRYYVGQNAKRTSAILWEAHGARPMGGTLGGSLIHFGQCPDQSDVRRDAMMFIRMTEFLGAKSLGLLPSNVFNTVERFEEFLANATNSGT